MKDTYSKVVFRNVLVIISALFVFPEGMSQVKKGEIVEKKLCRADTNFSYAYYLPSYYDFMKRYPVIFIFEPAARGTLGVSVYKDMAEKHGYALFCSNNAKNGPTQLILDAAEAMFADVYSRFSLQNERTFMTGFSGGSRVASRLALMTGKINSVIGCGAAFSENIEITDVSFDYYGITGNLDFNYAEMMLLERTLDSMGVNNAFSIFDGPHQWPAPLQIEMAILWVELQDMKQEVLDFDKDVIDRYVFIMDSLQSAYEMEDRALNRIRTLKNWRNAVDGLANSSKPDSIIQHMLENKDVQTSLANNEALIDEEVALQRDLKVGLYGILMPYMYDEKPDKWWEKWQEKINGFIQDGNIHYQQMGTRLQSTITANCWMDYYIYMEEGKPDEAAKFLHVWEIIEPESMGLHWLTAKYNTETGNQKKAVEHLEACHELGMKNYSRLLEDTTFRKLIGYKRFDELIVEMDTLK